MASHSHCSRSSSRKHARGKVSDFSPHCPPQTTSLSLSECSVTGAATPTSPYKARADAAPTHSMNSRLWVSLCCFPAHQAPARLTDFFTLASVPNSCASILARQVKCKLFFMQDDGIHQHRQSEAGFLASRPLVWGKMLTRTLMLIFFFIGCS